MFETAGAGNDGLLLPTRAPLPFQGVGLPLLTEGGAPADASARDQLLGAGAQTDRLVLEAHATAPTVLRQVSERCDHVPSRAVTCRHVPPHAATCCYYEYMPSPACLHMHVSHASGERTVRAAADGLRLRPSFEE